MERRLLAESSPWPPVSQVALSLPHFQRSVKLGFELYLHLLTVQADERFGTVQTAEGTNNFQQPAVLHFVARDFGSLALTAQAVGSVPQAAEFVGTLMAAELSLLF